MSMQLNIKAVIFESCAIALGLFMGAYMGQIAFKLHPLWAFCAFFWYSYGLNYLTVRLFPQSKHWFMELLSSPPVFCMVGAFCINMSWPMDQFHMLTLTLATFLALSFHFYEAIIKINLRERL